MFRQKICVSYLYKSSCLIRARHFEILFFGPAGPGCTGGYQERVDILQEGWVSRSSLMRVRKGDLGGLGGLTTVPIALYIQRQRCAGCSVQNPRFFLSEVALRSVASYSGRAGKRVPVDCHSGCGEFFGKQHRMPICCTTTFHSLYENRRSG